MGEGLSAAPGGSAEGGAPQGAQPGEKHGAATVRVTVGGQPRDVVTGTTVADLLAALGVAGKPCAVEINQTIVQRGGHATHSLREGDAIEIVSFVGGG